MVLYIGLSIPNVPQQLDTDHTATWHVVQLVRSGGVREVPNARLFDALLVDLTEVLTTMLGVYARVAHTHVTAEMADRLGMSIKSCS